jgi:hypothetical protein
MNDPVETIRVEIKVAAPDPKADEKYMKKKRELSEKINAGEQRAREKRELIEKINAVSFKLF